MALIRTAKKKGEPYHVIEMSYGDFINIKQLATYFGNTFSTNSHGEKVSVNDIRVLKVEKKEPLKVFYKTSYSESEFKTINVKKTTPRKSMNTEKDNVLPPLSKAYKSKFVLNENKIRDLKFLLDNGYIPSYYTTFYRSLINQ